MMHKLTRGGILALALFALASMLGPTTAEARWKVEEVRWIRVNSSNLFGVRDTAAVAVAVGKVDTTAAFDIDDADFPMFPLKVSATAQDTTVIGKVMFYADSTVASTVNYANTAFVVQVNSGSNSSGWQTLYTYTADNQSGAKVVEVPIWSNRAATITRDAYVDRTGDYSLFGNQFRIIATWGTAAAAPRTRVKLVTYLK